MQLTHRSTPGSSEAIVLATSRSCTSREQHSLMAQCRHIAGIDKKSPARRDEPGSSPFMPWGLSGAPFFMGNQKPQLAHASTKLALLPGRKITGRIVWEGNMEVEQLWWAIVFLQP